MNKPKLLVFHQALAPYRIDLWNTIFNYFETEIYFVNENVPEQKFDQKKLQSLLNKEIYYLLKGFSFNNRVFRFLPISKVLDKELDYVYTYEYSQVTIFVLLLKKVFSLKFKHLTLCDDSLEIAKNCSGLRKYARNFVVKNIDNLVLVNNCVSEWYLEKYKLKNKPFILPIIYNQNLFSSLLHNALPNSNMLINLHSLNNKKILFYVGRLETIKGVDLLLSAFSILKFSSDIKLIIIGDGSQLLNLKKLSSKLNISENVHFTGKIFGNDLYSWYNIGQIFILPSLYEPFGAVVSEALQSGAKVLCSSLAGASELARLNGGTLFDPNDINKLATIIDIELSKIEPINNNISVRNANLNVSLEEIVKEMSFF